MFRFILVTLWLVTQVMSSSRLVTICDPSDDPYFDSYTDTIVHLNATALRALPRLDDNTFLQSFSLRTLRMASRELISTEDNNLTAALMISIRFKETDRCSQ